jgi:cold shock CspA family protein
MLTGVVASFDARRGDGWLLSDDGERLYFHCVTIADGSRTVAVGQRVRAKRTAGHLGRDEATEIVSLG